MAQRLQAFQSPSHSPTSSLRENPSAPVSTPLQFAPEIPESRAEEREPSELDIPLETQELKQAADPERSKEMIERGRSLLRLSEAYLDTEDQDQVDQILEDVRSRLVSVQSIVRRERSGSSQARDEMMHELGSMLDNAIATTMSPFSPSPRVPPRRPSSKTPSSIKYPLPQASLSRSESMKVVDASLVRHQPQKSSPLPSPSKASRKSQLFEADNGRSSLYSGETEAEPQASPLRNQSLEVVDASLVKYQPQNSSSLSSPKQVLIKSQPVEASDARSSLYFGKPEAERYRQASEPAAFRARRTGFPLSSPVRERALLWESMSRGSISEYDTANTSPHSTRFRPVSPKQSIPDRLVQNVTKVTAPPIPLALPQLLEAERREQQARLRLQSAATPSASSIDDPQQQSEQAQQHAEQDEQKKRLREHPAAMLPSASIDEPQRQAEQGEQQMKPRVQSAATPSASSINEPQQQEEQGEQQTRRRQESTAKLSSFSIDESQQEAEQGEQKTRLREQSAVTMPSSSIDESQRHTEQGEETVEKEEISSAPELESGTPFTSDPWPGHLRPKEVGVGTSTVQETPSAAQAAEHDEHYQKPRASLVRTTFKDLLSATRRKVSGRSSQAPPPNDTKDGNPVVKESEIRGSIADIRNLDHQHLPQLQAAPDETARIQSTDGTWMSMQSG